MRAPSPRLRFLRSGVLALAVLLAAPAASAAEWDAPVVQGLGCTGLAASGPLCRVLAAPGTPANDDPVALAALGSPSSPEEDLAAALARLAAATEADAAEAARREALDILEGGPLPGRVYDGIPLLNWNAPAKVKTVPAGGTVEIREVRFPDHSLSDAWLLAFEAPAQPYTIRYRVSELGGTQGGELTPAPLRADGSGAVPAEPSALLPGELRTGTRDASRFTVARGLTGGGRESSRLAEQVVEVRMPAPGQTRAILQPAAGPHAPSSFTLHPVTDERRAAAEQALGFAGAEPTAAERAAAIGRLAAAAPERKLWDDLRALPAATDPGFLAAATDIAAQDAMLVDEMRTRGALPAGTGADPDADADVTLVLQNNETYVSRTSLRPAAGGRVRVRVLNRDGFAHSVSALALHDRVPVQGPDDWGHFAWTALPGGAEVAPGDAAVIELDLPADAFTLWLGDDATGDQAATLIALEQGPRTQSIMPTGDVSATPLHQAMDAAGDHWVTLAGVDAVLRLTPAGDLADSERASFLIPGGRHTADSEQPALEPSDVAVDQRGVVWTTLALGNGIARIDPAAAEDGTTKGGRVYPLPACGDDECPVVFPPDPAERPTRLPLQMKVTQDAQGNTLVWFTEANVDAIGLLRVAPDGTELGQTHFSCGCQAPLGIGLDQSGDVWFTEGVSNRIGRLTPDASQPYAAAAARLRHHRIPSSVLVDEPELSPVPVLTSNPHSLTIDRRGLVWFSESATGKLGYLDPEAARNGTSAGIGEIDLPHTDFGTAPTPADLTVDRAGKVFWADEYGDIVGTVLTEGAREDWRPGRSIRPAARRSLTDSPLVDPAGDLWFLEAGANRITRVSGVSAGNPAVPARPTVAVDAAADELSIAGLDEATAVDVRVLRGAGEVGRAAGVAVTGGAARIAAWGAADALRPGDVVAVQPHGADLQPAFAAELPALEARQTAGGVAGTARLGVRPAAGAVVADGGRETAVDAADGSFRLAGTAAELRWIAATPGARWEIRTAVAPAPAAPQPPATPPTPDVPAPATPVAPTPAPADPAAECPAHWLDGRPAFLGMTRAAAQVCLGRPRSADGAVRRYAGGVTLGFASGRVTSVVLESSRWSSARGGLRVGARVRAVRAALPGASRAGAARTMRALLPLARGRAADIRVATRGGRVRRIEVRDVARSGLDRASRALLKQAA